MDKLGFAQSAAKADLIIIGQKVNEGPLTFIEGEKCCPSWIEVKVKKVLLGKEEAGLLRIHSWSGMCGYGIVIANDKDYVLIS